MTNPSPSPRPGDAGTLRVYSVDGQDRVIPAELPAWDASIEDRAAMTRALTFLPCRAHRAPEGQSCWPIFWPGSDHRPPVCAARARRVLRLLRRAPDERLVPVPPDQLAPDADLVGPTAEALTSPLPLPRSSRTTPFPPIAQAPAQTAAAPLTSPIPSVSTPTTQEIDT